MPAFEALVSYEIVNYIHFDFLKFELNDRKDSIAKCRQIGLQNDSYIQIQPKKTRPDTVGDFGQIFVLLDLKVPRR